MLAVQPPTTSSNDTQTQLGSLATPMSDGAIGKSVMDAQTRIVARKEHVFREGDNATHIFRVESSHVYIYRMLADGRGQIVDFAFAGDFIGLGAGGQTP
jgi:CRP-like cAMP-binding protein